MLYLTHISHSENSNSVSFDRPSVCLLNILNQTYDQASLRNSLLSNRS